ncbi:MAG: glutaredoxin [Actinobacteria bacterium]|nr:glutaredoxin [Actinomycetota bacterium]
MSVPRLGGPRYEADPIAVTLVASAGCHFCESARQIIENAAASVPLDVREVDLESPEGQALQSQWRAPYPPMVIIDGEMFGYGRISERKLLKHLDGRTDRPGV